MRCTLHNTAVLPKQLIVPWKPMTTQSVFASGEIEIRADTLAVTETDGLTLAWLLPFLEFNAYAKPRKFLSNTSQNVGLLVSH